MGHLHVKASQLPTSAGVYLFKDEQGDVLYVGKAIDLRARVRQYLAGQDERFMIPFLVAEASDVDVIVTNTGKEALLLENTLIKKHQPRFNVKLRDDSNFLHLRLDPREAWPRYTLVRRIKEDGARYYGPYASASRARSTEALLQRAFPLRTCTDAVLRSRKRPCLLHQMSRCAAPCVGLVDAATYRAFVDESGQLLQGNTKPVVGRLRERMLEAAEALSFEEAARLRDLMRSVEATMENQAVIDPRLGDRDAWGLHREGAQGGLAVIPVRAGVMGQPRNSVMNSMPGDDAELLSSLLNATYAPGTFIPPEIHLPLLPPDAEALEEVLTDRRGKRVVLKAPSRGNKRRMVELAQENARVRYQQEHDADARLQHGLQLLADAVGLAAPPQRIECFDNSNLQGTSPVAAMAVFIDGRPARREYRRYRIKTVVGADDYASMREIIGRRLRRAIEEGVRPDLIVVDGGKGQVAVATAVRDDLGLEELAIIGLSKPRTEHQRGQREATDKIVLPHIKNPIRLPKGHPGLRILQHLRDEVHNHAIRYHRKVRRRDTLASLLESIPGVGPTRRKALLRHRGSAQAVAESTEEELAAVPGIGPSVARTIYLALHPPEG